MLNLLKTAGLKPALTIALAGLFVSFPLGAVMSVGRQNQLIQRYCAVCHTDAIPNGGLTLQHFDAAKADPSLAAMLLSKLTGGAMGAAGLPFEKAEADALETAMKAGAAGAQEWTVTRGPVPVASIVREIATKNTEQPSRYRLVITCDARSRKGAVQLSWAPSPRDGIVKVSIDGGSPVGYRGERYGKHGQRKRGNDRARFGHVG